MAVLQHHHGHSRRSQNIDPLTVTQLLRMLFHCLRKSINIYLQLRIEAQNDWPVVAGRKGSNMADISAAERVTGSKCLPSMLTPTEVVHPEDLQDHPSSILSSSRSARDVQSPPSCLFHLMTQLATRNLLHDLRCSSPSLTLSSSPRISCGAQGFNSSGRNFVPSVSGFRLCKFALCSSIASPRGGSEMTVHSDS